MQEVKHISIYINRSPVEVYGFASNPENLRHWAAGLASSNLKKVGNAWIAYAPFGNVKIKFVGDNAFGVMDHDVELESGRIVHNPMRVVPNEDGSEFIFTLLRQQDMTDEQFIADKQAVEKDLATLKALLEQQPLSYSGFNING